MSPDTRSGGRPRDPDRHREPGDEPPEDAFPERTDVFAELKRRKVYRVGVAYLVVALATLEGSAMVFPVLGLGPAVFNGLVVLVLLGFPLCVALAWTFDLTSSGIQRTPPVAGAAAPGTADRWVRFKAAFVGAAFVGVVWVGARVWQPLTGPPGLQVATSEPWLAVLPFEEFSRNDDQTYFADGLHEELLNQLASVAGVRLKSRTSLMHFRDAALPLPVIADSLGVDYILEGSVRSTPDSVALTVQLINGATDEHLWSMTLPSPRTVEGLFQVQATLAARVASALGGTLADDRGNTGDAAPTSSMEAYNAYLRGVYESHQFGHENWRAAATHLERAVELDPDFGRAHARLAGVLAWLNNYGGGTGGELFPRIRTHAEAAIRLIPDDPWAHMAILTVHWMMEWDWEASRRDLERALELNPDFVQALWVMAEWHGIIHDDTDRALELLRRAERVDPFSLQVETVRMWILINGRRFEEAVVSGQAVLVMNPGNTAVALELASCLSVLGRDEEARRILDPLVAAMPRPYPTVLALPLARVGDEAGAREIVEAAVRRKNAGGDVAAAEIAMAYSVLGDVGPALDWLERSFASEGGIYYLRAPDWDNVANDPRFHALWERAGLPGEHPARQAD